MWFDKFTEAKILFGALIFTIFILIFHEWLGLWDFLERPLFFILTPLRLLAILYIWLCYKIYNYWGIIK